MNARQKLKIKKHRKHHSKKHIELMKNEMKKGKTFNKAHTLAQKQVGK